MIYREITCVTIDTVFLLPIFFSSNDKETHLFKLLISLYFKRSFIDVFGERVYSGQI